ncbi:major facilitator superfamily domain-containing protein 6-like [Periplaneta americana]|uniref:major facilitator superfamily domain-containing protein 6-like n=1 Tax=Periplaneta americana TaxID=6978 RepID=UPI0037E9A9FD
MHFFEVFVTRITKDFRQKELLPLKLLFFVHASTLFVLYPYLTIHMRELGINVEETAIMSAVTPIVAIVMPPVAGMVADRIGNFRILLAIFSALGGAVSLLLLLVPVGRVTVTYPERVILDVGCGGLPGDGFLDFNISDDQECHKVSSLMHGRTHQVDAVLESCGFVCQSNADGSQILETLSYDVVIDRPSSNTSETYSFRFNPDQRSTGVGDKDLRSRRNRKNNDFYRSAIRNLSSSSYFFPTTSLYNLSCVLVNSSYTSELSGVPEYQCSFGTEAAVDENITTIQPGRERFKLTLYGGNKTNKASRVLGLSGWASKENSNATCSDVYSQVTVSVPGSNGPLRCAPRCLVTAPRKHVCSNLETEELYNISLTFWTYLVIRVFIGMIGGTAFAMFEGAVIAILREQSADYGLQRIYATIGGMISSPLSGLLIDYASRGKGYTDFRPAFYLYAGLKIASGLLMLTINLEFKAPATNVVSDVMLVLKNIEIVALFIAIFVLGTAWGYIESFLFWLLQDLGGSRSLMGITITVGGIAGIPLLAFSGLIIDKIGHANVLFIGFIFYAIRLFGYSLIYNPWLCLIFEAMEGVTSSLSFTAAVTYAAKLSTTTTDSSIQGLLGGVYFGVGKGAGSLIGGYMMKAFGTRPTYRIFAVSCTITGTVYFLFNKFYLRKRPQVEGNDIVKKKPKNSNSTDLVEIDLSGMQKGKEVNDVAKKQVTETVPINTSASKSYSSADKFTENTNISEKKVDEQDKQMQGCSDNLGYSKGDEDGDGYVTIDEGAIETSGNAPVQARDKETDEEEVKTVDDGNQKYAKDHDNAECARKNDSL